MPNYNDGFPEETINFKDEFSDEEQVTEPEYPPEGLYHVKVDEIDCSGVNYPGAVFMSFEILSGNVPDQAGKSIRYVIWPPRPDAKNPAAQIKRRKKTILRLMLALGLRKQGEFPQVVINDDWWHSLEGRQCVVRVTLQVRNRTSEGGKKVEWISADIADRSDFFPIGDPAVVGVPLDEQAAKIGGYIGQEDI